ncbi:MAG: helix-turn-helix domain-containing protein [Gaiellaceae bacterium]
MLSGDLLLEARRRAGLSQAELARRAGKPTSVIGRWERHEVVPSYETLRSLVRACGLELRLGLDEIDDSLDDQIEASLDLTPAERLARLEGWAAFVLEARASVA